MTKRRADQSQLDWLWDTYGEKVIISDPSFAENGDILDKAGVSRLVQNMIGSILSSLELQESKVNNEMLEVVGITHNGQRNVMFSLDKEDHLVKIVVRMSSQADIDAGNAEHINKPFIEFDMFSGKAFGFCLENMTLTGANTSTISTLVQGGYINCELIIANNNDKAITCKATSNGLHVGLNLAQKEGQVGLEKVDNGLVVRLKWDSNKDVMFKEMSWARYSIDTGNNGNTDGIIYFVSDKGYISLNGIKYGAIPEDVIRFKPINDGNNNTLLLDEGDSISSGKEEAIINLIKMNNGAVIVGDKNAPLRLFGSNEHVRFNGEELVFMNEFLTEQDRVNIEISKLDGKVDGSIKTLTEFVNTSLDSFDKVITEEVKPDIDSLKTLTADLNTSILNHIKNSDEKFKEVKEETDRLQKVDETLNNNMVEGFNTINKNVSDGFNTINGAIDNEIRPAIQKNTEDIATTNKTLATVNQNLADSIAKINEAFTIGFNTVNGAIENEIRPNIKANTESIGQLNTNMSNGFKSVNDCIDDILKPAIEANKNAINTLNEKLDDSSTSTDEEIKKLNETIATVNQNTVDAINIINKNMADGFNTINGGINNEIRPVIEKNSSDIAEIKDSVDKSVKWVGIPADDAPNRKSIELSNYDMIATYTSEGQKVPIAVVSRSNRLDLGASVIPVNLKGSGTNPTYNGNNIALAGDIASMAGSIKIEKQDDETYVLKVGDAIAGEIKFIDKHLKNIDQENDIVTFIYDTNEGEKTFSIDLNKYIDSNLVLEETNRAKEAEKSIEEKVDNKVDWADVATEENPGRKAITLENHDILLGKKTDGSSVGLAMLSKWDKADYGSVTVPINLNGSEERPTYNDDKELALMDDLDDILQPVRIRIPLMTLRDKVYTQEDIFGWFGVDDIPSIKKLVYKGPMYLEYGIILSTNPMYYKMNVEYFAFESANQIKMVFNGLDMSNDHPCRYEILINLDGTVIEGNSNVKVTKTNILTSDDISDLLARVSSLETEIAALKGGN